MERSICQVIFFVINPFSWLERSCWIQHSSFLKDQLSVSLNKFSRNFHLPLVSFVQQIRENAN